MEDSDFVNVNAEARILTNESAGSAGVIEVDMSKQKIGEVGDGEPAFRKLLAQYGEASCGAAIHKREFAIPFEEAGRHGFLMAEEVEVNDRRVGCDGLHA